MKDLIVMKIGGSVCTEKSKGKFKARLKPVARIASEIVEARKEKDFRLVVVNGAGPFGHVNVTDYDIDDGLKTLRDFEGLSKTVCDCAHLNYMVSDALRKKGLVTIPYPTTSVTISSGKKIVSLYLDVIKRFWDADSGIVPVMNGDMVPDLKMKGSVVSGDAVIEELSNRLGVKRIVIATDVDGNYTTEPKKGSKAKLVDVVTKENFKELRSGISGSSNTDVTGGMLGKVERLLSLGTETIVVNGNAPGRVRDALLGKPVKGTVVRP